MWGLTNSQYGGICSLIFPTYMGLVFLGVESLEPHSRPLFAGIAVSAAVSFAFGRQAASRGGGRPLRVSSVRVPRFQGEKRQPLFGDEGVRL